MTIPGPGGFDDPSSAAQDEPAGVDFEFLFDFKAMVEELREHERIVDVEARTFEPVPGFTIETIEHGLGIVIPRRIWSFYEVTDGLEFHWTYRDDEGEERVGGGAHLWGFTRVFDVWLDTLWKSPQDAEVDEDFVWNLRGFDGAHQSDTDEMVVLCVEEEYPTYDLFLHDPQTSRSQLLELSFVDYFDRLLETRGTHGWQALFGEEDRRAGARARELIEMLFPDATLR
jgi:hypothetical protein